jgi:uroporphyrinogen III methyltransferase/synthase
MKNGGTIYLVGAGPGDQGCLTMRGAQWVSRADVVIHGNGVNLALVALAPAKAKRKSWAGEVLTQGKLNDELLTQLLADAKSGRNVVLLWRAETWGESLPAPDPMRQTDKDVVWKAEPALRHRNGTLAVVAGSAGLSPMVVNIVADGQGNVPASLDLKPWLLAGQRIVVTRARDQASTTVKALNQRGAEVLEIPVIKTEIAPDKQIVVEALTSLNAYDWIVFTSVNGVNSFFDLFFKTFKDMRDLGGSRIAAVGPATSARLESLHIQVDVVPKTFEGKHIAKAMADFESMENRKVLLARAETATTDLPQLLEELGAIVDDVPFYRTVPETEDVTGDAVRFAESGADWVTFTSPSTVENFNKRFPLPKLLEQFPGLQFVSIGPETTKALEDLNVKPAFEAKPHTVDGMIKGMEDSLRKSRSGR